MAYENDAPYDMSRSALRKKFGARKIDGSAPPSARNSNTLAAGVGAMGGRTSDRNWTGFFRPVTPDTGMFSAGTMGATAPQVAPLFSGVPVHDQVPGPQPATQTMASTPPLQAPPVDYLKAAHERSTQFWNAQGKSIGAPAPGAVQAGTSFRNKFGTGSVSTASEVALRRMMRKGTLA